MWKCNNSTMLYKLNKPKMKYYYDKYGHPRRKIKYFYLELYIYSPSDDILIKKFIHLDMRCEWDGESSNIAKLLGKVSVTFLSL